MSDFSGRAWVDGRVLPLEEARVPVTDRGFLYADSVYDTARTYQQRPFLLGDHLDRLRRSGEALGLEVPWEDEELRAIVTRLLEDWPRDREATIRVVVTRGDGGHGLALPSPVRPRLVVLCRSLEPLDPSFYREGAALGRPSAQFGKGSTIPAHVKSGSYLANVLVLREVCAHGAFEGLLRGTDGGWSEATTSNLFIVSGGRVTTPGVGHHILPGITRAVVLSLARSHEIEVEEARLDDEALETADEIFLTSSIKDVLPISHLDGVPVADEVPGPVTLRLMDLYSQAVSRVLELGADRLADVHLRV